MVNVNYKGKFEPRLQKLYAETPDIKPVIRQRINWFRNNPDDTRLENHALTKRLKGKWAFSITDDIRIVYEWLDEHTARFLTIGTHKDVYGKNH